MIALAVPLAVTLVILAIRSVWMEMAKTGFAMTLLLLFYSFGENLEILAYLYWPALVLIGISLRPRALLAPSQPTT